eukprot:5569266-Amphidinium_carterae.2
MQDLEEVKGLQGAGQIQIITANLTLRDGVWQVAENVFSLTKTRMPADYEKDKEDLAKRARLTLSEAKLIAVFEQLGPGRFVVPEGTCATACP